jgi:hypothetical protein
MGLNLPTRWRRCSDGVARELGIIQARATLARDPENKDRAVDRRLSGIVSAVQDLESEVLDGSRPQGHDARGPVEARSWRTRHGLAFGRHVLRELQL